MTPEELRADETWQSIFRTGTGAIVAPNAFSSRTRSGLRKERSFALEDVEEVIAVSAGKEGKEEWLSHEPGWLGLFRGNGVYLYVEASWDVSGWTGKAEWCEGIVTLIAMIPIENCERLGVAVTDYIDFENDTVEVESTPRKT
jgi:hypothetical protein